MDCPFCAETIQDAAILCRFCGARKVGEEWREPAAPAAAPAAAEKPKAPPGQFTMHFAALCFLVSAAMEVYSIRARVPLFGDLRGGAAAIAYHVLYVGLYVAVGIGVWGGWRWGYKAVMGATLFYTVDSLRLVLDRGALLAQAQDQLNSSSMRMFSGMVHISAAQVIETARLTALGMVVCWWGFAAYAYFRRDYFEQHEALPAAA